MNLVQIKNNQPVNETKEVGQQLSQPTKTSDKEVKCSWSIDGVLTIKD